MQRVKGLPSTPLQFLVAPLKLNFVRVNADIAGSFPRTPRIDLAYFAGGVVQVKATDGATPFLKLPGKSLLLSDAVALHLSQTDVNSMSKGVFGLDYSEVQKIIYPSPAYRAFLLKKRGGGNRLIEEPRKKVKLLQLQALAFFSKFAPNVRPCVHGFVKDRSILTNANAHWERRPTFVLNLDLKDFFPSISFFRVRGLLKSSPFGFSYEIATVFAHLCTHAGKLPQGAPTSPYISNLICRSMDRDLMALASRHRCTYTRYADDMTFSFSVRDSASLPANICALDGGVATIGEELRSIIKTHSFDLNDKKTRISSSRTRQEVTGLTINQFPNVQRKFIDSVRGALHAWEAHGYAAAEQSWQHRILSTAHSSLNEMAWARQTRTTSPPRLHNLIWGKLLYMRMIRSERDALYNRLAHRYNDLVAREMGSSSSFKAASLPVNYEVHGREHAAKAVYVIEWMGDAQIPGEALGETEMVGSQGTAFAYRRSDLLITCEHVLRCDMEAGGKADFDTAAGAVLTVKSMATGFESAATLVGRDLDRDLAVLRIDSSAAGMRHFVRSNAPAGNGMSAHLLGFPNWSAGRPITLQPTTILSVFPKKGLAKFEVSGLIRKGNSGGPVASDAFELLGVAQEGATQSTGNNECLCVSELDRWLDTLDLVSPFDAT